MPSTAKARWATIALDSRLAPVPQNGAEPGADHAAPVALGELVEAGDAGRAVLAVDDEEVELLAAVALRLEALDVGQRLLDRGVRPPREPARDLGVAGQREQRGRVVAAPAGAASAWDHATRCWRCSSTSTATYRRWRRCSTTPARPGADRWLLGGDYARVRRLARRDGRAAARAARRHLDPRQRRSLGRDARRPTASPRAAACEAAGRSSDAGTVAQLGALPESADLGATARAPGTRRRRPTSPPSGPSPATTSSSCSTASRTGAWSSATSTSPSTASAPDRDRARRPGGGRHPARRRPPRGLGAHARRRAHRAPARSPTTMRRSAARVREVARGAPWGDVVAGRIERAGLE